MLTALRTNCQYQEGARQELGISESFMNVLLECGVVQSREISTAGWQNLCFSLETKHQLVRSTEQTV